MGLSGWLDLFIPVLSAVCILVFFSRRGEKLSPVIIYEMCIRDRGGTKDVEFILKTSLNILNYAYKKGWEYGVYYRLQAIVFTECCLALGLKSRILHCLPFGPYDFDSHVISIVYIATLAYIDNHQDKK